MDKSLAQKRACHFTVEVRRAFPVSVDKAFSAWTDPGIRRKVLAHGRYNAAVKAVDVTEGGLERYEARWKSRLYSETQRRYVIVRPARLIVAQSDTRVTGDGPDQHFAKQEQLLFQPRDAGCDIIARDQCVSIEPSYVYAAKRLLHESFDIFADLI